MKGKSPHPEEQIYFDTQRYLVKCCLRDRVVFYGVACPWERMLKILARELSEDGSWYWSMFRCFSFRTLPLERRVQRTPVQASGQGSPCYSYNYCIAISKLWKQEKEIKLKTLGKLLKRILNSWVLKGKIVPVRPRNQFQRKGTGCHILNTYSIWAALPSALDMTSFNPHLDLWDVTEKLKPRELVTCSGIKTQKW